MDVEEDDDVDKDNRSQDQEAHFTRACAVEMHMDRVQEPFCVEIYKKTAHANPATHVLRELAQSKCTWTFHKSHLVGKFTGHWPDMDLDKTPGRNTSRKNAFSVATLFGE